MRILYAAFRKRSLCPKAIDSTSLTNLTLQHVTREVARWGAQLRARFNIRTPDALRIAASLKGGATAFITNDRSLLRLTDTVNVIILDDYR
jgi:predicted nucleic acid-binding protein